MTRQLGAVSCGHERSAKSGAEALADGGNAIDAAVAGVFTSCTCEPTLTGIGGAGFMTVHLADGTDTTLDFFAAVPGIDVTLDSAMGPVPVDVVFGDTTQTFHVGARSCAVPGFIAGMLEAHGRWGKLPLARVLEPGIEVARTGITMTAAQSYCHSILSKIVTRTQAGRDLFNADGVLLDTGDLFSQPALADTLELIAEQGSDVFYRGDLATEIVRWSADNDGLISRSDLAAYAVRERRPVTTTYRGLGFCAVPPPSSGGALVAYALSLIDAIREGGTIDIASAEGLEYLARAMIESNVIRGEQFDGYLYRGGLVDWLLDPATVAPALGRVRSGAPVTAPPHPSSRLGSTTHLSVIDAEGNAVAVTTSTGCGSGEFVTDTGIHLNNMLGEEDLVPVGHVLTPGERLTSMMGTSLVMWNGAPLLATGSSGSNRIRSAILQTLVRVIESRFLDDRPLQERLVEAVSRPRIHPEGGIVHVEPGYPEDALQALERSGHRLIRWPDYNLYFGGVNMVARNDDGSFAAAADPRRGGGTAIAMADGSVLAP